MLLSTFSNREIDIYGYICIHKWSECRSEWFSEVWRKLDILRALNTHSTYIHIFLPFEYREYFINFINRKMYTVNKFWQIWVLNSLAFDNRVRIRRHTYLYQNFSLSKIKIHVMYENLLARTSQYVSPFPSSTGSIHSKQLIRYFGTVAFTKKGLVWNAKKQM